MKSPSFFSSPYFFLFTATNPVSVAACLASFAVNIPFEGGTTDGLPFGSSNSSSSSCNISVLLIILCVLCVANVNQGNQGNQGNHPNLKPLSLAHRLHPCLLFLTAYNICSPSHGRSCHRTSFSVSRISDTANTLGTSPAVWSSPPFAWRASRRLTTTSTGPRLSGCLADT